MKRRDFLRAAVAAALAPAVPILWDQRPTLDGQWQHFAITRAGDEVRYFVDGFEKPGGQSWDEFFREVEQRIAHSMQLQLQELREPVMISEVSFEPHAKYAASFVTPDVDFPSDLGGDFTIECFAKIPA